MSNTEAGSSTQGGKGKDRAIDDHPPPAKCYNCGPKGHTGECWPLYAECGKRHKGDCFPLCHKCQKRHPADSPNCQGWVRCKTCKTKHNPALPHRECGKCGMNNHDTDNCRDGGGKSKKRRQPQQPSGNFNNYYDVSSNSGRGEVAKSRPQGHGDRKRTRGGGQNAETKKGVGPTTTPKPAAEPSQKTSQKAGGGLHDIKL